VTALSTFQDEKNRQYLVVTFDFKQTLRIYELDTLHDKLIKVFDVKHVT
jgi:hypothetical protein